ncbi:ABC transporter permease [Nocardioides pakistanensis]
MRTWWEGTWLVALRSLTEQVRSRTFKVVTGLLLLLSIGGVVAPQLIGDDETTYTLATVGEAPTGLVAALEQAESGGDFTVEFVEREDRAAVRRTVADGDATAGLVGDKLFTFSEADGTFPVLVAQAAVAVETTRRLSQAGLTPEQIQGLQSVRPPEQVSVGRVADEDRAGLGFLVGIVLYIAITFAGNAISTTVAMEKSTRISEVLLAVLRPSQALVGTVLAVGIVTFVQLLVLAVPLAIGVRVTDAIGLPAVAAGDLALAVAWFVVGFTLYAFLFAATSALVDKVTEAASAVLPVMMLLIASYMLAVTVVMEDPSSIWSTAVSIFPFSAPVAMPIRWAAGHVPTYQLWLALAVTAVTAVLLARLASAMYSRALLITGRRAKLREVLR